MNRPSRHESSKRFSPAPEKKQKGEDTEDDIVKKWLKRVTTIGAAGLALVVAGNIAERQFEDTYRTPDAERTNELALCNTDILNKLRSLPFDASGHFEKTVSAGPEDSNSLELQLQNKNGGLVVEGHAQHQGYTDTSHTFYDDPVTFTLTYPGQSGPTSHLVPTDVLKQTNSMPTSIKYRITEERPARGGTGTFVTERDERFQVGPEGNLESIRVGRSGLLESGSAIAERAKETCDIVANEIGLVLEK